MNLDLSELIAVLEAELLAGAELKRNLDSQKQSLIAWDALGLLAHVEAREVSLRGLVELESRRLQALAALPLNPAPVSLNQLIEQVPAELQARLRALREPLCDIFMRLSADEKNLHVLMENLLEHVQEALRPLTQVPVSLYSGVGAAPRQRPAAGLIRGQA